MHAIDYPTPVEIRATRRGLAIFAFGALAGYMICGAQTQNSEVREAEEAVLAACAQMPACLNRARSFTPDYADVGYLITRP